jgi:NTE family protein
VLVDPLLNDVQMLATINELLADDAEAKVRSHERRTRRRRIPYMLIAPEDPHEIGRLAAEVYRRHYRSPLALLRSPNIATLGRVLNAGRGANRGELLSYLLFAEEFIERLVELGRRDATRWLRGTHEQGRWQLGLLR